MTNWLDRQRAKARRAARWHDPLAAEIAAYRQHEAWLARHATVLDRTFDTDNALPIDHVLGSNKPWLDD